MKPGWSGLLRCTGNRCGLDRGKVTRSNASNLRDSCGGTFAYAVGCAFAAGSLNERPSLKFQSEPASFFALRYIVRAKELGVLGLYGLLWADRILP